MSATFWEREPHVLLRRCRRSIGFTQAELARRTGTTATHISRIESGAQEPSVAVLSRLLLGTGKALRLQVAPRDPAEDALIGPYGRRILTHREEIVRVMRDAGLSDIRALGRIALGIDRDVETPCLGAGGLEKLDLDRRARLAMDLWTICGLYFRFYPVDATDSEPSIPLDTGGVGDSLPAMTQPNSRFRLDRRTALVTGASRGLGVAIADGLAAAGADLVLTARRESDLHEVATRLRERHGRSVAVLAADLAAADAAPTLADAAWAAAQRDGASGRLDILVNNAGTTIPAMAVDVTPQDYDHVMTVNLRTPALLAADLGGRMAASGGGRIVNISSLAGLRALSEHYVYSMSKAALIMASKSLALEIGPAGVRVNTVCPTIVLTDMGREVWSDPAKSDPMLARISTGQFAQPEDVADAVVYLASDAADMLNGTELVLDGGFSAN